MPDTPIDINFPVALLYGEFNQLKIAFATDRPVRGEKPRCLDIIFKEANSETRIDFWDEKSWKEPNPELNDKPWTRQFLSALNHFSDLNRAAHKIEYVDADFDRIDMDLIKLAFSGLIPNDGEARSNAEQCMLQLVNYLQEYDLLPKLPGDTSAKPAATEAATTEAATTEAADAKPIEVAPVTEEAQVEPVEEAVAAPVSEEPKKSTWL